MSLELDCAEAIVPDEVMAPAVHPASAGLRELADKLDALKAAGHQPSGSVTLYPQSPEEWQAVCAAFSATAVVNEQCARASTGLLSTMDFSIFGLLKKIGTPKTAMATTYELPVALS